jgi:hypothetical protein
MDFLMLALTIQIPTSQNASNARGECFWRKGCFLLSAEQVLNPKLKGKPVIIGGDHERRGKVASVYYEA